jgi:ribose transport system ATP-binding protein
MLRRPSASGYDAAAGLHVQEVSKGFPGTQALSAVSLDIRPGEIHALVGGNGSGKSTLMKILAGVYPADSGGLEIRGQTHDLRHFSPALARRNGMHFVHQQRTTFGLLTVAENLCLGHEFEVNALGGLKRRAMTNRAAATLSQFNIDARPHDVVGSLSPATQTMIEIARACQGVDESQDRVLALDEPTATLAPKEVDAVLAAVRDYAAERRSILFISHRLEEVLQVAHRITVFRDGKRVATVDAAGLSRGELVELMVGRAIGTHVRGSYQAATQVPVLEAKALCGGAVQEVDLCVQAGEVVGIAGLAGSGRSTLLRLLSGVQQVEGGSLYVEGREVEFGSPGEALRAGAALLPEDRVADGIFAHLTLAENLSVANPRKLWKRGWMSRRAERADANRAIDEYDIKAPGPGASISVLSGGNQQKACLARALSRDPKVLLLDEPTQGVDVGARAELWRLIEQAVSAGTAVVVVTSDLEELCALSHRVVVFRDGRTVAELGGGTLTPDQIREALLALDVAA